jgi:probable HAF family extracellular repeat protein
MTNAASPSPDRVGRAVLRGLLDLRPSAGAERPAADEAVAQGLAAAKVYAFASADYPGAAQSDVFDTDGTTTVGAFVFDPSNANSPTTAFTFTGGDYQILTVPGSNTSIATGINGAGLIVGVYADLANVEHGFADQGGTFSNVDFPGASSTQVIGVNDAGDIVGSYFDAANAEHGFASSGGTFTAINFPLATGTTAFGINDAGEMAGYYTDAAGNTHGFIYAGGAFSTVDVAGARSTQLTRIKNGGPISGVCSDAVNGVHGLLGR